MFWATRVMRRRSCGPGTSIGPTHRPLATDNVLTFGIGHPMTKAARLINEVDGLASLGLFGDAWEVLKSLPPADRVLPAAPSLSPAALHPHRERRHPCAAHPAPPRRLVPTGGELECHLLLRHGVEEPLQRFLAGLVTLAFQSVDNG
jgi:hypothetical protein